MQALDGNFCYSNSRLINGGLGKEKQLLVEEQKLCRARARKFFLETNRRRKALEERRKLWDVQQQRLRENVLQQRRQQVQEATERFQRAHLPPSQRRRHSCKRNVPSIEDALNHIQGTLNTDKQSSLVSISRSCTPSPKTPTKPKSSPRLALSAVEAYTKLLQERSIISLRNNQESHEPQEKQDVSSQEDSISDCIHSESISSKDSLDFEEPRHVAKSLNCSAFILDKDKCLSNLKKHLEHPTDVLPGDSSRKVHDPKQKKQADPEMLINKNSASKCSWGTATEKALKIETHNLSYSTDHCIKSNKNCTNGSLIVSNCIPHTIAEPDTPSPKQESVLDLRQLKASDERQLKHPSATEILLPTKNGNSMDYLFGTAKPNVFLNNCTMDNTCQEGALEQAGNHKLYVSSQKELNASINNLNKISDVDDKTETKRLNTELLHNTCLNSNQSHSPKCRKCSEKEEPTSPVSMESSQRVCEVRFIKGILKKQSKYMSGDAPYACNSGRLTLTKQVALAIRDSVELTRAKNKELDNTAVKKKLRWFDEVHVDNEDKEQNTIKQKIRSKSSSLLQCKNYSEDHQPSLSSVFGAIKTAPGMTHGVPDDYHFTRHAWADVGVQVSLPQQHGDEVKVPPRNNKTSGPRAVLKERIEAAPVSSRTRKGTNIRPQSATEVSQIARAHGRLVMPRPPPRMDATEEQKVFVTAAPYGTDHASAGLRPGPDHTSQREGPQTCFLPHTHHETRADSGVLFMPHPPLYTSPMLESNTKCKPQYSHFESQTCSRRAGMGYHEKAPCLDCTPTDEEISQLWLGVRTALATKSAQASLMQHASGALNGRKHSAALGIRKLPRSTQPTKHTPDPFSIVHDMTFLGKDLHNYVHSNKNELQNDVHRNWISSAEPHGSESLHRQPGLTTLSVEEEKILLSLDRLNQRLHYVQEQNTGNFIGFEGVQKTELNGTRNQRKV